jgi:predicted GNAT family acetyltransferase
MSVTQRLTLEREGATAVLDYTIDGNTLSILHVETPYALRGQGIGGELVQKARTLANEKQLELIPICPFAKHHLSKHEPTGKLVAGKLAD